MLRKVAQCDNCAKLEDAKIIDYEMAPPSSWLIISIENSKYHYCSQECAAEHISKGGVKVDPVYSMWQKIRNLFGVS